MLGGPSGCLLDPSLDERQETDDDDDRAGDEQDLVPSTLMGEHGGDGGRRRDHGGAHTPRVRQRRSDRRSCADRAVNPATGAAGWLNDGVMLEKVLATIEVIRPALQADGGDIELVGVDTETGVVSVRLVGACGTCPVSTQTLKGGIERIMRDRVDGVTEVVNVAEAENAI